MNGDFTPLVLPSTPSVHSCASQYSVHQNTPLKPTWYPPMSGCFVLVLARKLHENLTPLLHCQGNLENPSPTEETLKTPEITFAHAGRHGLWCYTQLDDAGKETLKPCLTLSLLEGNAMRPPNH